MITSPSHFVISNYNGDPSAVIGYSKSYTLFDQSDLPSFSEQVQSKYPDTIHVPNCGHSLRNFFDFVVTNYSDLPPIVAFLKGNLIGRHVTKEYFEDRIGGEKYTPLFLDLNFKERPGVSYHILDGLILEVNNSWFVDQSRRPYVGSPNALLRLLYEDPIVSDWLVFAPGACYIVPRENLSHVPRSVYHALSWLSSYEYFPPEAYIIERIMHILFTCNFRFNSWCYDSDLLIEKIVSMQNEPERSDTAMQRSRVWRIQNSIRAATNYYRFH
jgi:hypothetical protein